MYESMGKPFSCMQFIYKKQYSYYKSHENLYQYTKSHALSLNEIEVSYDKNHHHHSTKLY